MEETLRACIRRGDLEGIDVSSASFEECRACPGCPSYQADGK